MNLKLRRRAFLKLATGTVAAAAVPYNHSLDLEPAFGQVSSQLLVRIQEDMDNLDPVRISSNVNFIVANAINSSLVKYAPQKFGAVIPDLAERWEVSPDGRTYTFYLRQGVKWQKGYGEVTAQDVKFSFDRQNDPKNASISLALTRIISAVEAIGNYQVKMHLAQASPDFLVEVIAFRPGLIVNRKAMETLGSKYLGSPVGSGAWMLDQWEPGSRIVLRPNPDYYGKKPKVASVALVIMKQDDLFVVALEKGDVDLGYVVLPDNQQQVVGNHTVRTITKTAAQTMYVGINTRKAPWGDVRVRKALWYATNKQAIIDGVFHGLAHWSDTPLNPYVFGYVGTHAYAYDPAKAKQLLAQAGYPQGIDTELIYYPLENWPNVAQGLQASWRTVGIRAKLQQFEYVQLYQRYHQGDFSLGGNSIQRIGTDQIVGYLLNSASIPFPNYFRYNDPGMDKLLLMAKTELNSKRRAQLYLQIQQKIWGDVPMVPLFQPEYVLAMRPNITGATMSPLQDFNLVDIAKM